MQQGWLSAVVYNSMRLHWPVLALARPWCRGHHRRLLFEFLAVILLQSLAQRILICNSTTCPAVSGDRAALKDEQ
jgi:hypothetical protein